MHRHFLFLPRPFVERTVCPGVQLSFNLCSHAEPADVTRQKRAEIVGKSTVSSGQDR